ncbi:MAG: putative cytokinetic ring protein SteA [Armatimonadota bacterium]
MRFPLVKPGLPMAHLLTGKHAGDGMHAPARSDRRTKNLTRRLRPGEIAVIDHIDLDGPAGEALVACKARAVVNVAPSISGRYPNRGPELLQRAGIPLIDDVGADLVSMVAEGEELTIRDGGIYRGEECLGSGRVMTPERLAEETAAARKHLDVELHRFVSNTLSYVEQESGLLFEAADLPHFNIDLRDRHVLVVVRGEGARQDLAAIRGYIRDRKPVLIGVDGGADLLIEQGFTPDIIFGDMDSVSDSALRCGAQLIVHAYPNGRCPGKARLDGLKVDCQVLPGRGTSEDVIMLAVYEKGAELLIAVGTHFNLIDFLDKNRSGMSSTFLVRLRVGSRLVDAKGVNRLYRVPYPLIHFSIMILAGIAAIALISLLSQDVQSFLQLLAIRLQRLLGF